MRAYLLRCAPDNLVLAVLQFSSRTRCLVPSSITQAVERHYDLSWQARAADMLLLSPK